jgi:hypothetical protein
VLEHEIPLYVYARYFNSKSTVAAAFGATVIVRVTARGSSYVGRPSRSVPLGLKPACHIVIL